MPFATSSLNSREVQESWRIGVWRRHQVVCIRPEVGSTIEESIIGILEALVLWSMLGLFASKRSSEMLNENKIEMCFCFLIRTSKTSKFG